jgi:transposase-like protein
MFKGRQFDQSVILLWVRWYLAYNLSLDRFCGTLWGFVGGAGCWADDTTRHRCPQERNRVLLEQRPDRGADHHLKTLKRAMSGRAGAELLRARMLPIHVLDHHTN